MKLDKNKVNDILNNVTEYNKFNALICMNEFKNHNDKYEEELNQSNYYAIALCEARKLSGEAVNQKDISMTGLQFLMVLIAERLNIPGAKEINLTIQELCDQCLQVIKSMKLN